MKKLLMMLVLILITSSIVTKTNAQVRLNVHIGLPIIGGYRHQPVVYANPYPGTVIVPNRQPVIVGGYAYGYRDNRYAYNRGHEFENRGREIHNRRGYRY